MKESDRQTQTDREMKESDRQTDRQYTMGLTGDYRDTGL